MREKHGVKVVLWASLAASIVVAAFSLVRGPTKPEERAHKSKSPIVEAKRVGVPTHRISLPARQDFQWNSIEAAEYRKYIENMRSIGMPEQTIRDVIVADVSELFAPRLEKLRSRVVPPYWVSPTNAVLRYDKRRDPVLAQELTALLTEKAQILKELLGIEINLGSEFEALLGSIDSAYSFVSPEKQVRLILLQQDFNQRFTEAQRSENSLAEIAKTQIARDKALSEFLSPEEKLEFDLRFSFSAQNLRVEMANFTPTEEEFRTLTKMRKEYDDAVATARLEIDPSFKRYPDDIRERQALFENRIRETLGEQRFQEYIRGTDFLFQQAVSFTDDAGLDRLRAIKLYELRYDIEKFYRQQVPPIRSSPGREEALSAVQQVAEARLGQLLGGEEVVKRYINSPYGKWVKQISDGVLPTPNARKY